MAQRITVKPGTKVHLKDFDTRCNGGISKAEGREAARVSIAEIDKLSYRLYAENARSILIVLQGMDTSGKDGVIRHVMSGCDALSTDVHPFKQPSEEELDHNFLWRIHKQLPRKGNIAIFNRSHYEDVLVVRVHGLVPEKVWRKRYNQINEFERTLVEEGTTILKFFLNISKDEQRRRLEDRINNPEKRWKFSSNDLKERKLWADYQEAYADALTKCNTTWAPWHIVPADRKWYRDKVISKTILNALREMHPSFPPEEEGISKLKVV